MPTSPTIRAFVEQGCRYGLLAGFVFGSNYGALQVLIPFDAQVLGALSLALIALLLAAFFGGVIGICYGILAGGGMGFVVGILTHYVWQPTPHPIHYRHYVRTTGLVFAVVVELVVVYSLRTIHQGNLIRLGAIVLSVAVAAWWGSARLASWYLATQEKVPGAYLSP
jgi:hypothetical protein